MRDYSRYVNRFDDCAYAVWVGRVISQNEVDWDKGSLGSLSKVTRQGIDKIFQLDSKVERRWDWMIRCYYNYVPAC